MKTLHVVLAAPAAADVANRRDAGDFLHPHGSEPARRARSAAPPPGAVAVVIDVLRATSTLARAFDQGAARVIAAATVAEAFELKRRHPEALLCGEREGRPVPGFDLGNSPNEYARERIAGRVLIFASTNGSQALKLAASASRTLLGAFVNVAAVVERVAGDSDVWLIASGKLGRPSLEDLACAGWMARALGERGFRIDSAEARLVESLAPADAARVRSLVQGASQGRYLRSLGSSFAADVEFCASLDAIGSAPVV